MLNNQWSSIIPHLDKHLIDREFFHFILRQAVIDGKESVVNKILEGLSTNDDLLSQNFGGLSCDDPLFITGIAYRNGRDQILRNLIPKGAPVNFDDVVPVGLGSDYIYGLHRIPPNTEYKPCYPYQVGSNVISYDTIIYVLKNATAITGLFSMIQSVVESRQYSVVKQFIDLCLSRVELGQIDEREIPQELILIMEQLASSLS